MGDQMAAHHDDGHLDVSLMSCDVARKNDMILNPRFNLKELLLELDAALVAEARILEPQATSERERLMSQYRYQQIGNLTNLHSLLLETFAALSKKDSEPWAILTNAITSRLTQPGVANELCVMQSGLAGCSRWVGVDETPT